LDDFSKTIRIKNMMFRKIVAFIPLLLLPLSLSAQSGDNVYEFLKVPFSVSAAGVGGNSVSSMVEDLNMCFHNPAILSTAMDNDFSVGYMHYVSDINIGSAAYSRKINERSAWMAGVRYVDYGSMLWTTPENEILGNTYAKDLALTGGYSWLLSEHFRAGSTLNLIYSALDEYSSAAIAVDLGVYYFDPEGNLSAGFVIKNVGSQIMAYDQTYESMPWDIQFGVSKRLAHAPIRLTLTAQNLTSWKLPYTAEVEASTTGTVKKEDFVETLFKHLLIGVEFIPSDNFLVSLGYNYRRVSELGITQRTSFGGFTTGFSMKVKSVRVGASYAKYHVAGSSLQMTLGMNMSKFGL
jgi:Type IX secretion system protein PorV